MAKIEILAVNEDAPEDEVDQEPAVPPQDAVEDGQDDGDKADDADDAGDADVAGDAEGDDVAEGGDETVILIDGEEVGGEDDDDPDDAGPNARAAVRKMRQGMRESHRRIRELERKLAEREVSKEVERVADPGPRPMWEEYGDDDEFARANDEWYAKKAAADAAKANSQAQFERDRKEVQEGFQRMNARAKELRLPDYDDARDLVARKLNPAQQAMIARNAKKAAELVYALSKQPEKLAELAAITDYDKFAYALAGIEGTIKVEQRKPPAPESRIKGNAVASMGTLQQQLAAAERAFDKSPTGDRTDILRIKRMIKAQEQSKR